MSDRIALRLHQDITPRSMYGDSDASQHINTLAIAYNGSSFSLGAEKSKMMNAGNILDNKKDLLSFFVNYTLSEKYSFFGRYDNLASEEDWNLKNDGDYTVFGIAKKMGKGVKLSVNIQSWADAADGSESENTLYLNLEYKF